MKRRSPRFTVTGTRADSSFLGKSELVAPTDARSASLPLPVLDMQASEVLAPTRTGLTSLPGRMETFGGIAPHSVLRDGVTVLEHNGLEAEVGRDYHVNVPSGFLLNPSGRPIGVSDRRVQLGRTSVQFYKVPTIYINPTARENSISFLCVRRNSSDMVMLKRLQNIHGSYNGEYNTQRDGQTSGGIQLANSYSFESAGIKVGDVFEMRVRWYTDYPDLVIISKINNGTSRTHRFTQHLTYGYRAFISNTRLIRDHVNAGLVIRDVVHKAANESIPMTTYVFDSTAYKVPVVAEGVQSLTTNQLRTGFDTTESHDLQLKLEASSLPNYNYSYMTLKSSGRTRLRLSPAGYSLYSTVNGVRRLLHVPTEVSTVQADTQTGYSSVETTYDIDMTKAQLAETTLRLEILKT